MANQFLVSVAKAIAKDPNTGVGLFLGKTNITSAFNLTMASTEVRGGIGNALLYTYLHDRKVDIKVEEATFDKVFLGMNVGQLATTGTYETLQTETVTLASGIGTCTLTPLSDIAVYLPDGTIQNVTPSGTSFTVVDGAALSVDIVYTVSTTADQITVGASTPPNVVDMTLIAEVRDNTGVIVYYLQINIPRYQVTGNYSLSLAANGVSTQALEGSALVSTSAGVDYYAKVTWVPVSTSATTYTSIVAIPSTLSYTTSTSATKSISVLAISGTTNTNVTTSCSFITNSASWVAGLHTGQITIAGSAAILASSGSVTVSYVSGSSTLTDSVNLIVA